MCIVAVAVVTALVRSGVVARAKDAVSRVIVDMEEKLRTRSGSRVRRVGSESMVKFDATVGQGARDVPLAVTIFPGEARARIQIKTHDISRADAEALEDEIAALLDLRIIERSDEHAEKLVREAEHVDHGVDYGTLPTRQADARPREAR